MVIYVVVEVAALIAFLAAASAVSLPRKRAANAPRVLRSQLVGSDLSGLLADCRNASSREM
jgi:hypothetical protein